MSGKRASDAVAVSFSERLANSQVFATLFRDGMALVEETASYLDVAGRSESKKLERSAAPRLRDREHAADHAIDAASSWLLLHRAVKEGEMTLAQAYKEKSKVRLAACDPGDAEVDRLLPEKQELDCALDQVTGRGAPARRDDACSAARSRSRSAIRSSGKWVC